MKSIPTWKHDADFLLTQVSFSHEDLINWRSSNEFDGPVFAGVMVLPSASMARKLSAEVPQLAVPGPIVSRLDADQDSGVAIACDLITQLRESGAFDGVHLIPVNRYREVASRLESIL